jgi:hypothetical protein
MNGKVHVVFLEKVDDLRFQNRDIGLDRVFQRFTGPIQVPVNYAEKSFVPIGRYKQGFTAGKYHHAQLPIAELQELDHSFSGLPRIYYFLFFAFRRRRNVAGILKTIITGKVAGSDQLKRHTVEIRERGGFLHHALLSLAFFPRTGNETIPAAISCSDNIAARGVSRTEGLLVGAIIGIYAAAAAFRFE